MIISRYKRLFTKSILLVTTCSIALSTLLMIVPETGSAIQNPPLPPKPDLQADVTFNDVFPDNDFATIVASQFGRISTDQVTQAELETITNLQIVSKQFASVEGIGYLTGIIQLRITENDLLLSLPDEIGYLGNLRAASLYDNAFTEIPATVGHWTDLESISLYGGNQKTLPPQISNWTKLVYLDLDGAYPGGTSPRPVGRLESIPAEVCNITGLADVQLQNNVLRTIPSCLGGLTNMTRLDISNNLLMEALPDFSFVPNFSNFDQKGSQSKTVIAGEEIDVGIFIPPSFRQLMQSQGGSFIGEATWTVTTDSGTEDIIAYTGDELPLASFVNIGQYTITLTIENGDDRALNDSVFTTYLTIIAIPEVPDTGVY